LDVLFVFLFGAEQPLSEQSSRELKRVSSQT